MYVRYSDVITSNNKFINNSKIKILNIFKEFQKPEDCNMMS